MLYKIGFYLQHHWFVLDIFSSRPNQGHKNYLNAHTSLIPNKQSSINISIFIMEIVQEIYNNLFYRLNCETRRPNIKDNMEVIMLFF